MASVTIPQELSGRYTHSAFECRRFPTREVRVGDVGVGADNPIRLQSMTIADTMNTQAVIDEAIGLFEAGAEIVRVTAPSKQDAENIAQIQKGIRARGYSFPLCADIHFAPQAAMIALEHAEKVRINPGNFADSKRFKVREYSDVEYKAELERIHDIFKPLVLRARELGRALRIGANHGSLSDRILNRYGDTPAGMVESALEFIRVAELYDYHDIIVSMKASNPVVMVQAYRLLVERFTQEGMQYPLHLGVTEAGDGRDARIKSSVGIGSLLEDGIGDTIRVSLTEDSVHELPPAREIARRAVRHGTGIAAPAQLENEYKQLVDPYQFRRKNGTGIGNGAVKLAVRLPSSAASSDEIEKKLDELGGMGVDLMLTDVEHTGTNHELTVPLGTGQVDRAEAYAIAMTTADIGPELMPRLEQTVGAIAAATPGPIVVLAKLTDATYSQPTTTDLTHIYRLLFTLLRRQPEADRFGLLANISSATEAEAVYAAALHGGGLLLDGLVDGVLVDVADLDEQGCAQLGLDVLQSVRLRMSRAEFISCPSCGRTLFNLQETTARIKSRTGHLKGVKIAVMGCIVNGPGEMADADFGYVGAGPGRVHLYREKELVKTNVAFEEADEELVRLIKAHGMWVDP